MHIDSVIGCDACGDREAELRDDNLCQSCYELQEPDIAEPLRLG